MSASEEDALRRRVQRKRSADDDFIFDVVVVPTFEDALIATLVNFNLQAVVIRHGFPFHSVNHNHMLRRFLDGMDGKVEDMPEFERGPLLGRQIAQIRPELDLYLVTDVNVEAIAAQVGEVFKRIFFGEEDHIELYSSIMKGVGERHRTPFFNALRDYAKQPTGVFHALPLARGKAIMNSNWIGDMAQFYGMNLFMAETSATSGGLDSLLDPVGPLKLAQEYAAAPSARAAPTSPPTARPPATRSWCRRWSSPTTSCWWTGTATSRTTTAWCWPARRWPTWTPIRWMNSRCTARCRCATSRKRC